MLQPGESTEVKGSGAKPYIIKNVDGKIWSCTCPAWRNSPGAVNRKTCKHIRLVHGAQAEAIRVSGYTASDESTSTGRTACIGEDLSNVPRTESEYQQTILDRAASEGRKLRPDEKAKLKGPPVLLALKLEDHPDLDVSGWWFSEKLDGVRCYWDGKQFITRLGNVYKAPSWFTDDLPDHPLDGELWMGRGMFQATLSIVRSDNSGDEWKKVKYVLFDLPHLSKVGFEDRQDQLDAVWRASMNQYLQVLEQIKLDSMEHLNTLVDGIIALGGEGGMIREPGSLYEKGESHTLLKVKRFSDAEAIVVEHVPGKKGKFENTLGALKLQMPNGNTFNVGSLTNKDRQNPPPIGATVTYRFTELTDRGIPKCASFICVRDYEG